MGQNGGREHIDPPQQVVPRDHLVQAKLGKELPLIPVLPPHHRRLSCRLSSRNHCSLGSSSPFSTASTHLRHPAAQSFVVLRRSCELLPGQPLARRRATFATKSASRIHSPV